MSAVSASTATLRVEGLRKSFGGHEVLKGIDLELVPGEVVVVFGRSGFGKSTLLRCINFLEEPAEGTIEVAGIRVEGARRSTRHPWSRRHSRKPSSSRSAKRRRSSPRSATIEP